MPTFSFEALTVDVGGVLLVPHHDTLDDALGAAGLTIDRSRFWEAHYRAMHAVDVAGSAAESFHDYVPAYCHHLGLRGHDLERAVGAIQPLFGPSWLWREPVPDSVTSLADLQRSGLRLGILSNSDGTVARTLAGVGVCQVGKGPLTEVACIVDSGVVGIAKPEAGIFATAVEELGAPAAATLHVGDSIHYDVDGARAAGVQGAHFDPLGLCRDTDHPHVASLRELLP